MVIYHLKGFVHTRSYGRLCQRSSNFSEVFSSLELAKKAGREEIDRHLAELLPLIEEGGFIPTIDHTVSPDISLEDFTYYMKRKADLLAGKF